MQAAGGKNKKEKTAKAGRLLFLLSPHATCIFRWDNWKMQEAGGKNKKEKTAKAGRLLFFYCRPQVLAFYDGLT